MQTTSGGWARKSSDGLVMTLFNEHDETIVHRGKGGWGSSIRRYGMERERKAESEAR